MFVRTGTVFNRYNHVRSVSVIVLSPTHSHAVLHSCSKLLHIHGDTLTVVKSAALYILSSNVQFSSTFSGYTTGR